MVKLNELALENVVGGIKRKIPQGVKDFATGFSMYYILHYAAAHDMVVPRDKRIVSKKEASTPALAGVLAAGITASAVTIGAYEGGKYVYRKVKNKLSSK